MDDVVETTMHKSRENLYSGLPPPKACNFALILASSGASRSAA
jgi:hypothetical protein